ncbi:MAG: ferrous iron transport protein A [Ruminiclostridium sp.]
MNDINSLDEMQPGEQAGITAVAGKPAIRRRLIDIGLVEGTKIECVGKSPFGDPKAFLVRGAVIAIRSEDCKNILIKKEAL